MTTYHPEAHMPARYIDTADVAKLVRATLKQAFPATKFSVTISRYSMGSSVDVRWTDGPTTHRVEAEAEHYCGQTFDGRDDSTHYHDNDLAGELVHFGNSSIHFSRQYSDRFVARVAGVAERRLGWPFPRTMREAANTRIDALHEYAGTIIHRLAENRVHDSY